MPLLISLTLAPNPPATILPAGDLAAAARERSTGVATTAVAMVGAGGARGGVCKLSQLGMGVGVAPRRVRGGGDGAWLGGARARNGGLRRVQLEGGTKRRGGWWCIWGRGPPFGAGDQHNATRARGAGWGGGGGAAQPALTTHTGFRPGGAQRCTPLACRPRPAGVPSIPPPPRPRICRCGAVGAGAGRVCARAGRGGREAERGRIDVRSRTQLGAPPPTLPLHHLPTLTWTTDGRVLRPGCRGGGTIRGGRVVWRVEKECESAAERFESRERTMKTERAATLRAQRKCRLRPFLPLSPLFSPPRWSRA